MAILVGDYMFARSSTILLENSDQMPDHRLAKRFATLGLRIVAGEMRQLERLRRPRIQSQPDLTADYLDIITTKTALFFAAVCECGALVGEGDNALDTTEPMSPKPIIPHRRATV